jgi:hemin uptake protein HemP
MLEHRSTQSGVAEHPGAAPREANPPPRRSLQRVDSHRLLGGQRELVIEHAGQEYHLRLTRNDKLILTK